MGFSLNYAFVFMIIFIGAFAVIYAAIPSDFFLHQAEYETIYQEATAIREEFQALDLTLYNQYGNDSAVYQYSSVEDHPDAPQFQTEIGNRFAEVWWGDDPSWVPAAFEVRDTEKREFWGYTWYSSLEVCPLYVDGEAIGSFGFTRSYLALSGYENEYNMTVEARGQFVSVNIILAGNGSDTIGDSWDAGVLDYAINYEIDFDAMKPSAWALIGQLITFQSPTFGIPGLFGEIVSYVIGIGFWATIAVIAYTIITKLIPTIQGGLEN